jgi:uncharacterized protein
MLIRFSTKNYLSFDNEVTLSMVPGLTRSHKDHVIKDLAWNGIDILPIAIVYGANASGKSNLVKAMKCARDIIVNGTTKENEALNIVCHRLNKACYEVPSKFEFEFKYNEKYYIYGFEADENNIQAEWLYYTSSKNNKKIFERKTLTNREISIEFENIKFKDHEEQQFFEFVAKGTRPNHLFLTESIQRNIKAFQDVYSWFTKSLKIILPFDSFDLPSDIKSTEKMLGDIARELKKYDIGITDIILKPTTFKADTSDTPDLVPADVLKLGSNAQITIRGPQNRSYIVTKDENNNTAAFRLMTKHKMNGLNEDVLFDIGFESDGTQRLVDLIPAFASASNNSSILAIDEFDRSLHPNLVKNIMEEFINNTNSKRGQLIVTTHESNLLDLKIFRKDEIWFTEKNNKGATSLYSLEEFLPRYDKDIRKGYLLGRFGAVPLLSNRKN